MTTGNNKKETHQPADSKLLEAERKLESLSVQVNGKNLVIESLKVKNAELNSRINEIENSNAWKFINFLRKIRLFLAPPGSSREKIVYNFTQVFQKGNTSPIENETTISFASPEHARPPIVQPKIGYMVPGTDIAGGIAVVFQHANRLLQRGYDVAIISEGSPVDTSWYPGQRVPVLPLNQVGQDYDILIATSWSTAYPVSELPGSRKFYFVQSDERRFFQPGAPEVLTVWDTYKMNFEFLTMARWIQTWLRDEFGKESVYLPIGLDEGIFFQTEPIAPKGEKVRVLLEGNIGVPFKGMEDAFHAADGLDCEVWCVSSNGKPKPEWKCDRFFERVAWDQMRHVYSSCDVLLKMSRVESFSMPPLEMMACGGTAVVGKVTGIDEYIIDNYNALVVAEGDVEGAHAALGRLIEDVELRSQLTRNGKLTADQRKWGPTIDILEKLFIQ